MSTTSRRALLGLAGSEQTWADIRKLAAAPEAACRLSFKSAEYRT